MTALIQTFALAIALADAGTPLKIETGLVTGVVEGGVRVYKGIPYAAAPVGDLRWRAPRPPASWEGIRAADRFGTFCVQDVPASALKSIRMGEDCLTLNVWTSAAHADARQPVMVWIHGGGFRSGTGAYSVFNGAALARRGVVVVTINYRLGDFGLFAHPAMSAQQRGEPLANYQLMDQMAALRWVQKNIAAFDGDPGRVMVFGESAGGLSVLHLMGSPAAKGLFQRAASQSGGGFKACRTLAELEKDGQRIGEALGLSIEGLRAIPAAELAARLAKARGGAAEFAPVIDGTIVTDIPSAVFRAGKQHPVPLLIGANSFEGSLVAAMGISGAKIASLLSSRAEEAKRIYGDPAGAAEEIYGDLFFVAPARHLAASMDRARSRAWLYHFSYVPEELRGKIEGAHHGMEVTFVFGNRHPGLPLTEGDMAAAARVGAYWVQFAKEGDPNAAGMPPWPVYSSEKDELLELGSESFTVRRAFRKDRMDLADAVSGSGLRLP